MRVATARVIFALTFICSVVGMSMSTWMALHAETVFWHFGEGHSTYEYASSPSKALAALLYFTIWSNILTALVSLFLAIKPNRKSQFFRIMRVTSLVMIIITGIIYNAVLRADFVSTGWMSVWSNNLEHVAVPVLAVVGWLLYGPRIPFQRKIILGSLIIPLVYAGFTLLHGLMTVGGQVNDHWYPYPFLDAQQSGYVAIIINIVVICVLYVLFVLAILGLDKVLPKQPEEKLAAGSDPMLQPSVAGQPTGSADSPSSV